MEECGASVSGVVCGADEMAEDEINIKREMKLTDAAGANTVGVNTASSLSLLQTTSRNIKHV